MTLCIWDHRVGQPVRDYYCYFRYDSTIAKTAAIMSKYLEAYFKYDKTGLSCLAHGYPREKKIVTRKRARHKKKKSYRWTGIPHGLAGEYAFCYSMVGGGGCCCGQGGTRVRICDLSKDRQRAGRHWSRSTLASTTTGGNVSIQNVHGGRKHGLLLSCAW